MKFHIQLLTAVVLISAHSVWGGEIYKWVDESGNVHFSDQPGKSGSERVDVPKFKTDPVLEQHQKEHEDELEKEKADNAKNTEDAAAIQKKQEQRQKNCVTAKERIEQLQTVRRLFTIDANGDRHDLSDEERKTELQKAQEDVKTWCD